jgi:hypothetical protein
MKPPSRTSVRRLSGIVVPFAFCAVFLCSDPASAGGWAADTFSNDIASDFLGQIVPNGGVETTIGGALDAVLLSVSTINDERASRALAAAEMVAAMVGNPSRHLPAPCKEWAKLHSKDANQDLVQSAVRAIDRVAKDSETQELMQEGGAKNLQDWQLSVTDLRGRLVNR